MGIFQGPPNRTKTSKKLRPFRKKKKFLMGRLPTETEVGEHKVKILNGRGNTTKVRLIREQYANINTKDGATKHLKILKILGNPANVDYNRRGVITKGCIISTEHGNARVTSIPGSHGTISAILLEE